MIQYEEVEGDLIHLAKEGKFDVIVHGCNCFCVMGTGIATQMAAAFGCDKYSGEHPSLVGDMNKLGTIDHGHWPHEKPILVVVNAYTQYERRSEKGRIPLDYAALRLCLMKINHSFKGKHIGLPRIGAGLGGGDWFIIRKMIQSILVDCKVTVVNYKPIKT